MLKRTDTIKNEVLELMKFAVAYLTAVTVDRTGTLLIVCDGPYYSLSQRNGFIWRDLIVLFGGTLEFYLEGTYSFIWRDLIFLFRGT